MRITLAAAAVAAVSLSAATTTSALGGEGEKKCFDKGLKDYVACAAPDLRVDDGLTVVSFTDGAEYEGAYFAPRGGLMQSDDFSFQASSTTAINGEFGAGYVASAALGYQFLDVEPGFDLRVEAEFGYQEAELDKAFAGGAAVGASGEASVAYGFLNLFGDYQLAPQWELFVGGGAGVGVVDFEAGGLAGLSDLGDGETAFGYHLDAGLSYQLSTDVSLEAGYRFSSFQDVEVGSAGDALDIDSHQLLIGLKFKL